MADERWQKGVQWGQPRPAHPEGKIIYHIKDILRVIDTMDISAGERSRLRLIALIHDTFKGDVETTQPRRGANHHARRAAVFAEEFVTPDLVKIIETHDDAYNIWRRARTYQNWRRAKNQAENLMQELGDNLALYLLFYQADNACGDKSQEPLLWFTRLCTQNC